MRGGFALSTRSETHALTCATFEPHSDAAKRLSDTYRLHRLADHFGSIGHWFAVSLGDGSGDNCLYPSKDEAISHQHHNEENCAFVQIVPSDMTVCDAEMYLKIYRRLREAGIRVTNPKQMIPRLTREDMGSQMRSIVSGGQVRPGNLIWPHRK
jgi:hypothetical protein